MNCYINFKKIYEIRNNYKIYIKDKNLLEIKHEKENKELKKFHKKLYETSRAINLLKRNINNSKYPIEDLFYMYGVEYGEMLVGGNNKDKKIVDSEVDKFFEKINFLNKDNDKYKEQMSNGIKHSNLVEISGSLFLIKPTHYFANILIWFSPIAILFQAIYSKTSFIVLYLSSVNILFLIFNVRVININTKSGKIIRKIGIIILIVIFLFDMSKGLGYVLR